MVGILTEKFSAGKNFAKALGGKQGNFNGEDYIIVSSVGHIYEFAQPEEQVAPELIDKYKYWNLENLPWNENDFAWKKELKPNVSNVLKGIREGLRGCDEIVIATDNDPTGEGELLAWEILDGLKLHPRKWTRMYFEDESVKEIQKAFKTRKPIQSMLSDVDYIKADYRSKFDYLSMQFTRIATKCGDGVSVLRQGRLKSAMVYMVGDQLKLVSEYKKIPFYQNRFKDENGVVYTNNDEPQYPKKEDVPNVYHSSAVVVDSKTQKTTPPPKMLDLAGLSAKLAKKGIKAKDVLQVYQSMYEAQIVSYPRTEDKYITPEQFNELLPKVDAIAGLLGINPGVLTHRQPRATHVKTGCAHGANRPGSNVPKSLDSLQKEYGPIAPIIYEILARNYLATLAEDYEYESQKGHLSDYPAFVGTSNLPKKAGWRAIFKVEESGGDEPEPDKGLGTVANPFVYEGFPPKPANPTMEWLMKQLEKHDVGTGATRASIYADVTNEKTKYPLLIENKGKLTMSEYGHMSYLLLPGTNIGNVKITEEMQQNMRDIASGTGDPSAFLAKMQKMVMEDLKTMQINGAKMRQTLNKTISQSGRLVLGTCPRCGKDVVEGKNGYGCVGYKEGCKFVIWKSSKNPVFQHVSLNPNMIKTWLSEWKTGDDGKMVSSKSVVMDKLYSPKKDTTFKANVFLTDDKDSEYGPSMQLSFDSPSSGGDSQSSICVGKCPLCGKDVVEFDMGYSCSNKENKCKFVIWKKSKISFLSKTNITATDAKNLLSGKAIKKNTLLKRTGDKFTGELILEIDPALNYGCNLKLKPFDISSAQ